MYLSSIRLTTFYHYERQALDFIFAPKNVALSSAPRRIHWHQLGRTVLWNLISSPFGGAVFPVNPKRESVLGIKAYKSVRDIPAEVDLAVVVTQSKLIPGLIKECGEIGCKAAVVISAGFKEAGPEGIELERQLLVNARAADMRIVGPNCLGVMVPPSGVNATFAAGMARNGSVGFLSQSGALCTAVLDWSLKESVGFSAFMSLGSMSDVGWGDLITYLGNDPKTRSILIYMETWATRGVSCRQRGKLRYTKPIIVIKAGRTAAGSSGSIAHGIDDRLGRRAGRGVPPQRRAAGDEHRGSVLHGGSAGEAAASEGTEADDSDERGRSGGAGGGLAAAGRRRVVGDLGADHLGVGQVFAGDVVAAQSDRHHR